MTDRLYTTVRKGQPYETATGARMAAASDGLVVACRLVPVEVLVAAICELGYKAPKRRREADGPQADHAADAPKRSRTPVVPRRLAPLVEGFHRGITKEGE